ncbi:FAD-dependent oxidoreductase, partial [candidate division WOR-3 bacterium]|nr:FAD-dependent oxidoreductase [candidate division WOR-3 bacterium]
VQTKEGMTVLDVAKENNIDIPTLCYHEALESFGACRICVVEALSGKWSKLVTACNYPVWDGIEVKTKSERVIKSRKMTLELLLARCPDVKKIQDLAREYGIEKPRFKLEKDNCILCGLCVRICEQMGVGAIQFVDRGINMKIDTPYHVASEFCRTCGACAFVCPTGAIKLEEITENKPIPIPSEFDRGLKPRPAIYIPYPQAVPNVPVIDRDSCVHFLAGACKICENFCPAGAIKYEQEDEIVELDVGAIIVAPGYETFDPAIKTALGYKKYPNVLTSIELERILSPSGPHQGHILRPSDGATPKRIAFIQCVGSRDNSPDVNAPYCSGVCCMYSIKEAVIAKEHVKDIESTIFYMDIRAYGKDFDKYYERAQSEYGVKFIRSKVDKIEEVEDSGNLKVYYTDDAVNCSEFDMVILAVGFKPPSEILSLSDKLKVRLNKYNYLKTPEFLPVQTTQDGIFACGAASSPKDIPETVMQASGAVASVSELLSDVRGTKVVEKKYPPERDVRSELPKIGVFVCRCGINIAGVVDVPSVVEYAKTLPDVVYTEENIFTCAQDTQQKIKQVIKEHNLNRVVVASCSPRTHEPLFQETLREAGLNPRLFEMANIRDQCSWVHRDEPDKATKKAKTLVKMAVAKARLLEPLPTIQLDVIQKGLVIGGGLAGMVSALSVAEQGYEVTLVEREKELGGNLRNLYYTAQGEDVQEYLNSLIEKVENHPKVKVYKGANIENVEGYIGNYKTRLSSNTEIEHGIIIVATGAEESKPKEYLAGEDERVICQLELEKRLVEAEKILAIKGKKPKSDILKLKSIVMIQCVGSRDDEHPYCSRVCCQEAIKNALKLRELNPDPELSIYILYRDVRTYGFLEEYYQKARDNGILFIRYEKEEKPIVKKNGNGLRVKVQDFILGAHLIIEPDLVVLSPAIVPRKDAFDISQMLKVPLNEDGFFLEAHVKLRPVDFATEGVFLAGLAHSPKTIDESISQAKAASARACTIISKDKYEAEAIIASVNEDICSGCGICESLCSYGAPEIVIKDGKRVSEVNKALCKGCGSCVSACPSGAMQQLGFKSQQTLAMMNAALV